jgi:AcrR family transcriptional regulator
MVRLDRPSILRAGVQLAEARGLDAVTLRAVAAAVGVTPMALYRYVAGKDDLLDGMADLLYAELELPDEAEDWWDGLLALGRSSRRVLLDRPWAVPLFARPLAGPNAVRLGDSLLATFRRAGFSAREADELHGQLTGMVFALVAPELAGKPNAAAFERGIAMLRPGLEARLPQQ